MPARLLSCRALPAQWHLHVAAAYSNLAQLARTLGIGSRTTHWRCKLSLVPMVVQEGDAVLLDCAASPGGVGLLRDWLRFLMGVLCGGAHGC